MKDPRVGRAKGRGLPRAAVVVDGAGLLFGGRRQEGIGKAHVVQSLQGSIRVNHSIDRCREKGIGGKTTVDAVQFGCEHCL